MEELRNLKKLQKGSAGERMMDAYRNEVFKHSNIDKRKLAPEKLENWGREEMLKCFTCEKWSNYVRNLLGTYTFLNIFSILSIEYFPIEATVNVQCQQNGQNSIFSGQFFWECKWSMKSEMAAGFAFMKEQNIDNPHWASAAETLDESTIT